MKRNRKAKGIIVIGLLVCVFSVRGLDDGQNTKKGNQFYPAIYGDIVVWEDSRNGNLDIYCCKLQPSQEGKEGNINECKLQGNEIRITEDNKDQRSPSVYKNIVVWEDNRNGNWDIYGYNFTTKEEFQITMNRGDQLSPAIYEDIVVWEDNRNGNWDIFGCRLQWGGDEGELLSRQEFQITTNRSNQLSPAIYGDYIVWQDSRKGKWNIYGYDLSQSREIRITEGSNSQLSPAIYEDIVVWMDRRNYNWDIYGYDLSQEEGEEENEKTKEFPIIINPNDQRAPAIYKGYIVWYDNRNWYSGETDWDIYCYYCSESREVQITADPNEQRAPAIFDKNDSSTIVWMDYRNCNWEIYSCRLTPIPPSLKCPESDSICRDGKLCYLAYGGVPILLAIVILSIYSIAKRYPRIAFEYEIMKSEEVRESEVYQVSALKDPLSRFLFSRLIVFLAVLSIFFIFLVVTSILSRSFIEIETSSLSREKVVLLHEEAYPLSTIKDPAFILIFLIPVIVFYPARVFFAYISCAFQTLFEDGIFKKKKRSTENVLDDFNRSLTEFEKRINEKSMYLFGFLICSFGLITYFISIPKKTFSSVSWCDFDFFPANSIVASVVEFSIWFMFGIFIWKMICLVHFTWQLNRDYILEFKPYDIDGAGGFGPLEELWLKMSYVAIPVLLIPIILFFMNHFIGTFFDPFSTSVLCGAVVVILLVFPVWNYHNTIETQKTNFLERIEQKIEVCHEKVEEVLSDSQKKMENHYIEQINQFQEIALKVKGVPSLPFKRYQKIYITLSAIAPLIPKIISYFT